MSWKELTLSDLYKVASSKRVLKSDWKLEGIPFYRGREISSLSKYGYVENDLYITEEMYKEFTNNYGVPVANDIMVTAIGTIGNTYVVKSNDKFYFKDASVLWLKKEKDVDSNFINYWFKSNLFKNQLDVGLGATVDTLTIGKVQSLKINVPTLNTQQKIVSKLDVIFAELDTAMAAAEANIKNAEALFQSYLTDIYEHDREGWNKKKISEIAKIKGGKRVPKGYELKNEITPYVYLRVTNFSENGDIDTTDLRYVDSDVWNGIKNYIIESEDLYVSIAGTIGRTGMVSEQLSGSLLTENACRLVFNNDINNRFVYYFTKSSSFISQTVEQTRTTAQPKLALSRLGEITLAIPSLDEQLEINKKLDLMTSQISIYKNSYEQKIIELNALNQAILQKAFSGELVKE